MAVRTLALLEINGKELRLAADHGLEEADLLARWGQAWHGLHPALPPSNLVMYHNGGAGGAGPHRLLMRLH